MSELGDAIDAMNGRLKELGDRLADAADAFGLLPPGVQMGDWATPPPIRGQVPDWPDMPASPAADGPGLLPPGVQMGDYTRPPPVQRVPDFPASSPGPDLPDWPDLPQPGQAAQQLADLAPQLQGPPEAGGGGAGLGDSREVIDLLTRILAVLERGVGSPTRGGGEGEQGGGFTWTPGSANASRLARPEMDDGTGDGYAAASPSMRHSRRAGARGAGGYGHGSAHSPGDLEQADYAEPDRRVPAREGGPASGPPSSAKVVWWS